MANGDGTWGEYARLILAELERLNKVTIKQGETIDALNLEIDRLKNVRESDRLARVELAERIARNITDDQNPYSILARVKVLENAELGEVTIKKYRGWIISGILLFITSLVIPLIGLYLSMQSGGG